MAEVFEQTPSKTKEKLKDYPEEKFHRVMVERKPSERAMDVQIPRFKRMGYEEIAAESTEECVMMAIPRDVYNKRTKERQEVTTKMLMEPGPAGIEGESLNQTSMSRQSAETFFAGDGDALD